LGMWLSSICITPISIFIFYKANKDAKIFELDWYSKVFRKIFLKNESTSNMS